MSWIAIAIVGHLLNAVAFIVDKTLLSSSFKRSGTYAAVIGLFSALVLFLAPWISHAPDTATWIAIGAFGISFVMAMWGFFEALGKAETSRVVPVVGSLIPLFTLILAALLVHERLTGRALLGLFILIGATLLLTRSGDKKQHLDARTFWICIGSAFLFAASTAFGKYAFQHAPFLDVFVLSRIFAAITALLIPVFSKPVREELLTLIKPKDKQDKGNYRAAALLFFGQACGALGFVGVQYAVSIGSATVVNALQAVQYAAIVLVAWLGGKKLAALLKEDRRPKTLLQKGLAILLVAIGLALVSWMPMMIPIRYGITWSMPYASELGLDGRAGFERALNELHPAHVRIMAYWSDVEKQQGSFDFSDLDWQLDTAERYGVPVTIAVGARLPRWPECWTPDWTTNLDAQARMNAQMEYLKSVYRHEEERKDVASWQIENEPQLSTFQSCPGLSQEIVTQELAWVRGEEQKRAKPRPVGTTDSGELSLWLNFPDQTDQLGVSVYRVVSNPLFGTIHWLLPADFYADKAAVVRTWTGQIYVSEFQMEPWFNQSLAKTPIQDQVDQFTTGQMRSNFDYATRLELPSVDFWGAEWWLWMEEKQNHPEYWQMAKDFLTKTAIHN